MAEVNNYDDYALKRAERYRSGQSFYHLYLEKPAMYGMLPESIEDFEILCVGCGTAEESEELTRRGAQVTGIDLSPVSVKFAQESYPASRFAVSRMERLPFKDHSFDMAYSSLALHYPEDLKGTLTEIKRVLRDGGILQCSLGHPVRYSGDVYRDPEDRRKTSARLGFDRTVEPVKLYGDYLQTRRVTQEYPTGFTIQFWTRPVSEYLQAFLETGYQILQVTEPKPVPESAASDPELYNIHSRIPLFLMIQAST